MRRPLPSLLLLGLILASGFVFLYGVARYRAQVEIGVDSVPPPTPASAGGSSTSYTLSTGLWRVDNGFVSIIHIKNPLEVAPLEVTPVLYLSDGSEYDLPSVHIPPTGLANVNVNDALANCPARFAGRTFNFGSAALRYQYSSEGHLLAMMEITDLPRGLALNYPFSILDAEMPGTQTLEGAWWRRDPGVTGFLAVTNVTNEPLSVSMTITGSLGTALDPIQVAAPPHWTQLLDLDSLVGGFSGLENQAGGIRLQYNGPMGAILFSGGLLNELEGYSATMPFMYHNTSSNPTAITYASVGLMVGQQDMMMGFPRGTWFTPYSTLRNATSHPLAISAEFNYMAGPKPVSVPLPVPALGPFETRQLDFAGLFATLGLDQFSGNANLIFSFNGRAGDLVLATGSMDQTANFVFSVEPQGVGKSMGKASAYWTVGNGFDTMYTAFNPTNTAEDVIATVHFGDGSGQYELPIHLEAQASAMFDLMDVIQAARPDVHGKVIPSSIPNGGVVFESAEGRAKWMTLVVSGGVYNAHRATCTVICIYCYGYISPTVAANPFAVPVQGTTPLHSQATYSNGRVDDFTSGSNWSSNNTSVATVGAHTGVTTGMSVGSPTITANLPALISCPSCTICSAFSPVCPVTVYTPSAGGSVNPKITGINPAQGLIGATTSVTISGTGFGSTPTVSAGSGITFSYTSRSDTQIVANFVVASNASAGNHAVTVTNTSVTPNRASGSVNFYVQVPTRLVRLDFPPGAPGGVGALQVITNGNVTDLNGNVILQNQCGVYRNYAFDLVDQETPPQPIEGTYTIIAHFTNYQGPNSTPNDNPEQITPGTAIADLQFFGKLAPSCPGSNDHESFDMSHFVTVGTTNYNLTTVIHISKGNFSGTAKVDSIITTP